jgi:hypothetical protein
MRVLKIVGAIGLLSLSSLAWGSADASSDVSQLPESLEATVQNVMADLTAKGYEVARGYWAMFGTDRCKYTIETFGNCLANNPTAPYIVPIVPSWRDEFVDKTLHLAFGPMRRGYSVPYRLGDREALVVLALLPPPGAYFGLQTYVFTRERTIPTDDPIYLSLAHDTEARDLLFAVAPNPSRLMVFSSIGNNNNNVVVERQSGFPFDTERFFIITTDAVTQRDVTETLLRAGVPDRDRIFVEPVSAELVRLGLGPASDDLMTLFRYAMPVDPDAGQAWHERLPLAVLRVRDMNRTRATEPYPVPIYDERTAISESALQGPLADLIAAVKGQWNQLGTAPDAPFLASVLPCCPPDGGVDLVGQHCLERGMNCLGDTQDTDTYRISRPVSIDHGEVIAIVGTLATATRNATYVSLAVNRAAVLEGVANITNDDLTSTASAFSDRVSDTDKLYVYYMARSCAGLTYCKEIPESLVPIGETIKLIQRNYIRPGTKRGADAADVLSPSVIILNGTTRP